jgi:hypothetical protein
MTTSQGDPAGEPTPAQVRELATAAADLAARTQAMIARLPATDDDPLERVSWDLSDAADTLRNYQASVAAAAERLTRVRVARGVGLCGIPWGVCPEHGNTLRSSAGSTSCTTPGCARTWAYDRMTTPCAEPAVAAGSHTDGTEFVLCAGHALDVERRLIGSTVRYWSGREGHGPRTEPS